VTPISPRLAAIVDNIQAKMTEFTPFESVPGDPTAGLILLCDHARNTLPKRYGTLGLPPTELERHIAYDIGAEALMRGLAERLGAPGVIATFSRLLIDPNRGEDDPTLIRQLYDGTIVPGNYPLNKEGRQFRFDAFYKPYHAEIERLIGQCEAAGIVPAIFSVHTMTDRWRGHNRPWQTAVLWDTDPRFARPLLEALELIKGVTVGNNEPYDGALAGDTLFKHATSRGLANALIEVRQDLVRDAVGVNLWVERLAPIVEKINAMPHIHRKEWHGSRTGALNELPHSLD
jgi:predicted N-formylglutamate amidohydrolase